MASEESEWTCPACTVVNPPLFLICSVCLGQRPTTITTKAPAAPAGHSGNNTIDVDVSEDGEDAGCSLDDPVQNVSHRVGSGTGSWSQASSSSVSDDSVSLQRGSRGRPLLVRSDSSSDDSSDEDVDGGHLRDDGDLKSPPDDGGSKGGVAAASALDEGDVGEAEEDEQDYTVPVHEDSSSHTSRKPDGYLDHRCDLDDDDGDNGASSAVGEDAGGCTRPDEPESSKGEGEVKKDEEDDGKDDDDEYFLVEMLLGHRWEGETLRFLVKWGGYSEDHDSWEPSGNLPDVSIAKYCSKVGVDDPADLPRTTKAKLQRCGAGGKRRKFGHAKACRRWDAEEDVRLERLVDEHGQDWDAVLGAFNDGQCMSRRRTKRALRDHWRDLLRRGGRFHSGSGPHVAEAKSREHHAATASHRPAKRPRPNFPSREESSGRRRPSTLSAVGPSQRHQNTPRLPPWTCNDCDNGTEISGVDSCTSCGAWRCRCTAQNRSYSDECSRCGCNIRLSRSRGRGGGRGRWCPTDEIRRMCRGDFLDHVRELRREGNLRAAVVPILIPAIADVEACSKLAPMGKDVLDILAENFSQHHRPLEWKSVYGHERNRDTTGTDVTHAARDRSRYWWTYFEHPPVLRNDKATGGDEPAIWTGAKKVAAEFLGQCNFKDMETMLLFPDLFTGQGVARVAQLFVTGPDAESTCEAHRDSTDSVLLVIRGRKTVTMKRCVRDQRDVTTIEGHPNHIADTPLLATREERLEMGWFDVELNVGDGLMIPREWWHQVRSDPGTLALSCVTRLGLGAG